MMDSNHLKHPCGNVLKLERKFGGFEGINERYVQLE